MRRLLFPLILGVAGTAALVALGLWQLARLDQKEEMIARIDAAIAADPVPLPAASEDYLAVAATGRVVGPVIRFVYSAEAEMAVAVLEAGERRVMIDLGLVPVRTDLPLPEGEVAVTGNLESPEGNGSPVRLDQPNARPARDLEGMAQALGTEPILLVVREMDPPLPGATPLPVGSDGIPNNHLGYAIQWFGMALVWAVMSVFLILRARRPDPGVARDTEEPT
ncbi:SURF1 family protein [Wenxinia saemankumensis]|uniref:SURF1-like protein n=1 Tax=Wenxinia saemankumensis TaxID=1447782 RepID=A0A1M6GVX6_9RHOB|nr:SURF1 family protein [Wenxinia saemankumensis]SHJ14089.1 surfeit locus 1 family protein [Wenxinia saemankumensis]